MEGPNAPAPEVAAVEMARHRRRWWRRRPPTESSAFERSVWWAGQAQLFIAAVLAVVGPVCLVAFLAFSTSGGGALSTWTGVVGWLGSAMALPFASSGKLLRGYGTAMPGANRALPDRIVELVLVVVGIAALSIVFVVVLAFLLVGVVVARGAFL